jgi:hypothetical protein
MSGGEEELNQKGLPTTHTVTPSYQTCISATPPTSRLSVKRNIKAATSKKDGHCKTREENLPN